MSKQMRQDFLTPECVFFKCTVLVYGDNHGSWTLDEYKEEYEKLQRKLRDCEGAEGGLFICVVITVS